MAKNFDVYEKVFPDNIPPLYHYTSSRGLLGMLDFKQLWLTQFNFSNDASESSYGLNLIKEVMKEYRITYAPIFAEDENIDKRFGNLDIPLVFTFSMTEHGDMLSQWRGYCPNGGYSIRFCPQQLNAMMKEQNLILGKCIYELEEQKQFIRTFIIGYPTVDLYIKDYDTYRRTHWAMSTHNEINNRARRYAPLIKHPEFKEEAEWKIFANYFDTSSHGHITQRFFMKTVGAPKSLVANLEFREGKGLLIPYLKMPLAAEGVPVRILELVMSPTPHGELARVACQFLLDKHQDFSTLADNSGVARHSKIPYKNW